MMRGLPLRFVEFGSMLGFGSTAETQCFHAWNRFPQLPTAQPQHPYWCGKPLSAARSHTKPVETGEAMDARAPYLPLAAQRGVGHIRLNGDVAEWLKAAVC